MTVYVHPNAPYRIQISSTWTTASDFTQVELYWAVGSRLKDGTANPCAGLAVGDPACSVGVPNTVPCAAGVNWQAGRSWGKPNWKESENNKWNCGFV